MTVRLGDIGDIQGGLQVTPKRATLPLEAPYLRVANVHRGRLDLAEIKRIRLSEAEIKRTRLRAGDLLMVEGHGNADELGRVAVWDGAIPDCTHQNHLIRIRLDGRAIPQYIARYVNSPAAREQLFRMGKTTSGLNTISTSQVQDLRVPLPSLPEQRRIAATLDEADALRRKRREALVLLDDLLRSAFLDMFGDPVTNPRGWATAKLGEVLLSIDSGWSPNCEARPAEHSEWGVLKLGAVTSGRFIEDHKALPNDIEPQTDLEIQAGDVLFTRKNTKDLVAAVAYVHRVRSRLMFPDLVFRLRPDATRIQPSYLAACLMHAGKRSEVQALAAGSSGSMPGVSKAKLITVSVPTPPMELQTRFHRWVECHEDERATCVRAIDATETLFAALLDDAFTGKL